MRRHLTLAAQLIFLIVTTACWLVLPALPAASDISLFDCLRREAKTAVARAANRNGGIWLHYPDQQRITDEILGFCNKHSTVDPYAQRLGRMYPETLVQEQMNAWNGILEQKDAEKKRRQAELDAPKLKAELDAAWARYASCLIRHAKIMALNSAEPAEVIAEAAIPSCFEERQAIMGVSRKYNDSSINPEVIDIFDQRFSKKLVLETIKARAQTVPTPSEPPPAKHETPL